MEAVRGSLAPGPELVDERVDAHGSSVGQRRFRDVETCLLPLPREVEELLFERRVRGRDEGKSVRDGHADHTTATLTLLMGGSESNKQSQCSPPSRPIQSCPVVVPT